MSVALESRLNTPVTTRLGALPGKQQQGPFQGQLRPRQEPHRPTAGQAATCLCPPMPSSSKGSGALGDSEGTASGAVACRLKSDSEHSSSGCLLQIYKEPLKHVKYETAG